MRQYAGPEMRQVYLRQNLALHTGIWRSAIIDMKCNGMEMGRAPYAIRVLFCLFPTYSISKKAGLAVC